MRALIVDDEPTKAAELRALIEDVTGREPGNTISVAETLGDAARLLMAVEFDLVLLDLMLPFVTNGAPDAAAGLNLLAQVKQSPGPNQHTAFVGISAYPDEVASTRGTFDAYGVLIIGYGDQTDWRRSLTEVLNQRRAAGSARLDVDIVVVCALEEEREGVVTHLVGTSRATVAGLNVTFGTYVAGQSSRAVGLIRLSRMGLVSAANEVTAATSIFRAKVWVMTGICAGFRSNAEWGQVIVASPAWEYQAGKWAKNGFEIAPHQIDIPSSVRHQLDYMLSERTPDRVNEARLPRDETRPSVYSPPKLAPAATGSAVIADAARLEHIAAQHRKVAALDMETYGFYYALNNGGFNAEAFFSAKAVVDFADEDKSDTIHRYGCIVSAATALHLADGLIGRT